MLPLVGGLFVLVEALDKIGLRQSIGMLLQSALERGADRAAWGAGVLVGLTSNLINNLPMALIAGSATQAANAPDAVTRAILIGVDLGPNLSVTGSLATILWLAALRRDGHHVGAATFLRLGALIAPPALVGAIAAALIR